MKIKTATKKLLIGMNVCLGACLSFSGRAVADAVGKAAAPSATAASASSESTQGAVSVAKEFISVNDAGDIFKYRLVLSAKASAGSIIVTERLSNEMDFLSAVPAPDFIRNRELSWNFQQLEPGTTRVIELNVKISRSGTFVTQTQVQETSVVSMPLAIKVPSGNGLKVTKTCPEYVELGERIPYTVTVTNIGETIAKNVRVIDLPPSTLSLSGNVKPMIGDLKPGESREIKIEGMTVLKGKHTNRARVYVEGIRVPAEATATVTVTDPAQVQLLKTGGGEFHVAVPVEYQVVARNVGEMPLRNVVVRDNVPAGVTLVNNGGVAVLDKEKGVLTWNVGNLDAGQSSALTYSLVSENPVVLDAEATLDGVSASGKTYHAATKTRTIWKGVPGILSEIVDVKDPVVVGRNTGYVLRVTNQGNHEPIKVRLVFRVTPNLSIQGAHGLSEEKKSEHLVIFEEFALAPREVREIKVDTLANKAGIGRAVMELTTDFLETPIVKEESTTIY